MLNELFWVKGASLGVEGAFLQLKELFLFFFFFVKGAVLVKGPGPVLVKGAVFDVKGDFGVK